MFSLANALKLLQIVGPARAAMADFKQVYDDLIETFSSKDQATLKMAYDDLIADNDEGHKRLQAKLAAAQEL